MKITNISKQDISFLIHLKTNKTITVVLKPNESQFYEVSNLSPKTKSMIIHERKKLIVITDEKAETKQSIVENKSTSTISLSSIVSEQNDVKASQVTEKENQIVKSAAPKKKTKKKSKKRKPAAKKIVTENPKTENSTDILW